MNKSIDYRTDYYSLGVTFYELLTNQLPFPSTDTMELVHCHIAKKAVPPHLVNSEIPGAISEIVMKLLAENVEDRYQSALGIKHDLEFCLTQLQATGNILNFTIGSQDLSAYIQEEATTSEVVAKFYLDEESQAQVYLTDAYYGYIRPGAVAKDRHLEVKFPPFLSQITPKEKNEILGNPTDKSKTTSESLAALDLSTVLKASQAISEEIILENLLEKLMQIVTENAGAQKGFFASKKI